MLGLSAVTETTITAEFKGVFVRYHVTIRGVGVTHIFTVEATSKLEAITKACAELEKTHPEVSRLTCQFKVTNLG